MSDVQIALHETNSLPTAKQYQRDPLVDALTCHFNELIATRQKTAYYVTITYADSVDFPLSPASANKHLKHVHRSLLSHLTHHYNKPSFREIEPLMYAFLDVPNSKIKSTKSSAAATRLSTYHHECIVIVDEAHVPRFDLLLNADDADDFVHDCKLRCRIRSIKVQRIELSADHMTRVASYASKHYRNNIDDIDRLQLYPSEKAKTKIARLLNA